jgi:fructosamine-3-kinase
MSRPDIHYWKCDRPAAFHGTEERADTSESREEMVTGPLADALLASFGATRVDLRPAASQGIHRTWSAEIDGEEAFVRLDDSPDGEGRLEMESAVLGEVAKAGLPVPRVLGCDASRSRLPFAWQALERIPHPDLNHWWKAGRLDSSAVAREIGAGVARWQLVPVEGFGPFQLEVWRERGVLRGFHPRYADYFRMRLDRHLGFLVEGGLLSPREVGEIAELIDSRAELLEGFAPCLVHKDLALWNILGEPDRVAAFIDFDDAIGGDPTDDLSLLACFHDADFLSAAVAGYESIRPLPGRFLPRFWLHLLRNLIVKAVIRTGAGYFRRDGGFFLIAGGGTGEDLRRFTLERIALAVTGLREEAPLSLLD